MPTVEEERERERTSKAKPPPPPAAAPAPSRAREREEEGRGKERGSKATRAEQDGWEMVVSSPLSLPSADGCGGGVRIVVCSTVHIHT